MSRATIAQVRAGDAARGRRAWAAAAAAYRAALTCEPHIAHLWVQLGHMEKEAGAIDRAAIAYHEAGRLRPGDAEPLLHLGHMTKASGEPMAAVGHFVAALQREPANGEALAELVRLLPDSDAIEPALRSAILMFLGIDPAERIADEAPLATGAMLFDVTDLIAFFGRRRLPTGIQRVQIEITLACLARAAQVHGAAESIADVPPVFCLYASARRGWIALAPALLEDICRLARRSDDAEDPLWKSQLERLYRRVALARTIAFPAAAVLVNLGTSWADRNYLLDVRIARERYGIVYVALIFDLIPFIGPAWFAGSLARDYRAWFGSLLHSADGCLAISQATRRDLLRFAAREGAAIPDDAVSVVPLNGDFRQQAASVATVTARGLKPQSYVLFVSTLEPRKNHLGAFAAWLILADAIGEAAVPRLVCVGGRGWLNDDLHEMLRSHPALRRMVLILHGVPDDELAALYAHSRFVLYPSFYEGWGLPVSEALSWGKVPAVARTSSLPEVGGDFARYFDPRDPADMAATVRALLDDPTRLAAEAVIRRDYRARGWPEIAHGIAAQARHITARGAQTLPCLAGVGTWTLALPRDEESGDDAAPAALGEALRDGRAWQPAGVDGCRIRGGDAVVRFRWTGPAGAAFHIAFVANGTAASVRIGLPGGDHDCRIAPRGETIVSCSLPSPPSTLWIPIIPLTGEVVVARVSVGPATEA